LFYATARERVRLVDTGQFVRAGQLLMTIDRTDYVHAITARSETAAAAKAKAVQAAADEARYRGLVKSGAVSASIYDQIKAASDAAQAELAAAKAQEQVARDEDDYSQLVADADGVVIETQAEPGQVVAAGQTVVKPTTIVCGSFGFDEASLKPITQLLPNFILMKADQARTLALHNTVKALASEMVEQAPGSEVVATRLAEILVQAPHPCDGSRTWGRMTSGYLPRLNRSRRTQSNHKDMVNPSSQQSEAQGREAADFIQSSGKPRKAFEA
jgi:multidrug efflux pump subunit AcrA (membrane-fusion protein)